MGFLMFGGLIGHLLPSMATIDLNFRFRALEVNGRVGLLNVWRIDWPPPSVGGYDFFGSFV
jgi:hypothetical protein